MKYYTGKGDAGETYICHVKVAKTDKLIKAIGELDELNAYIGYTLSKIKYGSVRDALEKIEHDIYLLSGQISGYASDVNPKEGISEENIKFLENAMETYSKDLKDITNFVYPDGLDDATSINICRAIARRAERSILEAEVKDDFILRYINRLSSFFFVLFRHLNAADNFEERFFKE
jgi:cob(I)alamin adenosyltransferase